VERQFPELTARAQKHDNGAIGHAQQRRDLQLRGLIAAPSDGSSPRKADPPRAKPAASILALARSAGRSVSGALLAPWNICNHAVHQHKRRHHGREGRRQRISQSGRQKIMSLGFTAGFRSYRFSGKVIYDLNGNK
jgi:hypothetical protein